MTIKSKLIGSGLILSAMIAALLITSIYTFITLGAGFVEIIDKSKIGVSNSETAKSNITQTTKQLSIISKDITKISDDINETNMRMKLLERKIKETSNNLKEFTQLGEEVISDIPEGDLLYDLQEMFDTVGDIEEILRREALIGLTRTAKKMVTFTHDITKNVDSINLLSGGLKTVDKLSSEVVVANQEISLVSDKFSQKIVVSRNLIVSFLIIVAVSALAFSLILGYSISKRLNKAVIALDDIAEGEGDLTKRLDPSGNDEISALSTAFNLFSSKIQNIISQVTDASGVITQAVNKVTQVNESTNETVKLQKEETNRVASSVHKISTSIKAVANNASHAADEAKQAEEKAENGRKVVDSNRKSIEELADEIVNAEQIIQELEEKSKDIDAILETIRGVAEQTNLLALNAAIEAARAGENGRGFAVVADEVRTLAHKTHNSTNEIQDMILNLQEMSQKSVTAMKNGRQGAESSVEHANMAGASLNAISETISSMTELNNSVANATDEQLSSTVEIEQNIQNISKITETSIEGVAYSEKALQELAGQIDRLNRLVEQFKIS